MHIRLIVLTHQNNTWVAEIDAVCVWNIVYYQLIDNRLIDRSNGIICLIHVKFSSWKKLNTKRNTLTLR